jgi:hypothetical protein
VEPSTSTHKIQQKNTDEQQQTQTGNIIVWNILETIPRIIILPQTLHNKNQSGIAV